MNGLAVLDAGVLGPPLLAGLLVTATHVPLGREVLRRGIIFIDLAVAQIAGLGVIAAYTLGGEHEGWGVQLAATVAAVAGALLLHWLGRRWPQVHEALIGTSFVLAATGGLLLLAGNPHGAEHVKELLSGQLLWTRADQLAPVAVLYALVLALWFTVGRKPMAFYLLFALSVTASVQLVGVYLVFASLIVPALAVRRQRGARALIWGYLISAAGYAAGLILSAVTDLPTGPMVVWSLAAIALAVGTRTGRRHSQL